MFRHLSARAHADLAKLSHAIDQCVLVDEHSFHVTPATLAADEAAGRAELLALVSQACSNGTRAIYCVKAPLTANLDECRTAFVSARKSSGRKFARDLKRQSQCLYVGSSKSLRRRIEEHLGFGAAETYALQLAHWASTLGLTFTLDCATYTPGSPADGIQALEDALWAELQPAFGRRGAR